MYYYILDEKNTITNSIVLADGADPAAFGAVADERLFGVGDTWTPPLSEAQLLGREITEMQLEQIAQWQMMTDLQLAQMEGGKAGV